jgi:hypothetical protein
VHKFAILRAHYVSTPPTGLLVKGKTFWMKHWQWIIAVMLIPLLGQILRFMGYWDNRQSARESRIGIIGGADCGLLRWWLLTPSHPSSFWQKHPAQQAENCHRPVLAS